MKRKAVKITTTAELSQGEYAIVTASHGRRTAVLALSPDSFTTIPKCASIVNLANGIGGYGLTLRCRRVSQKQAFAFAAKRTP
jgi:hypothetical protein